MTAAQYFCRYAPACTRKPYVKNGKSLQKHEATCEHNPARVGGATTTTTAKATSATTAATKTKGKRKAAEVQVTHRTPSPRPKRQAALDTEAKKEQLRLAKIQRQLYPDSEDEEESDEDDNDATDINSEVLDSEFDELESYFSDDFNDVPPSQSAATVAPIVSTTTISSASSTASKPVEVQQTKSKEEQEASKKEDGETDSGESESESDEEAETKAERKQRRKLHRHERRVARRLRREFREEDHKTHRKLPPRLEDDMGEAFLKEITFNPVLVSSSTTRIDIGRTSDHQTELSLCHDLSDSLKHYALEKASETRSMERRINAGNENMDKHMSALFAASSKHTEILQSQFHM